MSHFWCGFSEDVLVVGLAEEDFVEAGSVFFGDCESFVGSSRTDFKVVVETEFGIEEEIISEFLLLSLLPPDELENFLDNLLNSLDGDSNILSEVEYPPCFSSDF